MDCDAVVIGSGAGGLTAAVALARSGRKVIVLEQHDTPGGWFHSFDVGGHQFSPGVLYIGDLGPGGRMRRIYEGLGIDLDFLEMNPDGIDHCLVQGERFDIPRGRERFAERLKSRFPAESRGIQRYFDLAARLDTALWRAFDDRPRRISALRWLEPVILRHGLRSMDSVLSSFVRDPLLKGILSVTACDHGLGPRDAPAVVHMGTQAHYFNGAWYPRGGSQAMPNACLRALKSHGGELRLSTTVERILLEGGRAIGIRLSGGEELRSPVIVSNADPHATFERMMTPEDVPGGIARRLKRTDYSISALTLFCATDADVAAMGADSGNWYYSRTTDVQQCYDVCDRDVLDLEEFPGQFLTFTTLKDRSKGIAGIHTMESFVFVGWKAFRQWSRTRFGERPSDYAALKEALTSKMVRGLDRLFPGLSRQIVSAEIGTPLSNYHFRRATQGSIYGTAKTRGQVGPFAWPVETGIPGLWMCGASTLIHGALGASTSGLQAAASVLGCRVHELLNGSGTIRTMPAEDPSAWPKDLRAIVALKERGAN